MPRATVGTALFMFVGLMGALPGYAQSYRRSPLDMQRVLEDPQEIKVNEVLRKNGIYNDQLLIDKYHVDRAAKLAFVPQTALVREPLPMDAADVLSEMHGEMLQIQEKADKEKRQQREKTISRLTELQEKYTRESKLDKAERIQIEIRRMKLPDQLIYTDPGSLLQFRKEMGKTLFFEVAGSTEGSVWGTVIYAGDSPLAAAAVHAGILKPGEKGIVKVTFLKSPDEHKGSTQHGVTSSSSGPYDFSYYLEAVRETAAKPE